MVTGRTHDARIFVDAGATMVELTNILGLTVEGETESTQHQFLGSTWAHANVHAMGGGVSFSTVYDTASFDAVAAMAESNPQQRSQFLILCPLLPASWHRIPVSWPRPSIEAPQTDAITRPWTLARAGLGDIGTTIQAFTATGAATARSNTIYRGLDDSDGGRAVILITSITGSPSAITIGGRAGVPTYTSAADRVPGIRAFNVASGSAANLTMSVTGADTSVAGFVLQGDREELPDG